MMVALRVVFRAGWALPNPVNRVNGTSSRYPFAVLKPTGDTAIESAEYDVTAPVKNATRQSSHDAGTGYTAAIAWSPSAGTTFAAATAYTATVTLTAATNYIFSNDFSAADVVGLPATTGDGHTAQTVSVVRNSATEVVITVKYVATAS